MRRRMRRDGAKSHIRDTPGMIALAEQATGRRVMPRISADEFRAMVKDISVPDREVGELLIRSPDDGNRGKLRDITLVPGPANTRPINS